MQHQARRLMLIASTLFVASLFAVVAAYADSIYPAGYTPSKPAAQGETNVLARFGAVVAYMNDKLNAAGGKDSPQCYRNCLTAGMNDVLKCLEVKTTYVSSESCEQDGAQKMSVCDPKCQ